MVYFTLYPSPPGELLLLSDGTTLTGLEFGAGPVSGVYAPELPVFRQIWEWLDAYFAGHPCDISELPLSPDGTPFQKEVWAVLYRIPFGQLRTYGSIAAEIAAARGMRKMSPQAVGQAVGRNPISIIIPCHRCVGSGGKLTGYAGGLDKKLWLLRHEGHNY